MKGRIKAGLAFVVKPDLENSHSGGR
jgi:hypothetical protein